MYLSDLDISSLICDPGQLSTLLTFEPDDDLETVRSALCNMSLAQVELALEAIVRELNIGTFIYDVSGEGK